jgi:hypothetical protein
MYVGNVCIMYVRMYVRCMYACMIYVCDMYMHVCKICMYGLCM